MYEPDFKWTIELNGEKREGPVRPVRFYPVL